MYGENVDVDLMENGSEIDVTNDNRERFVQLYVDYKLSTSVEKVSLLTPTSRLVVCQRSGHPRVSAVRCACIVQ